MKIFEELIARMDQLQDYINGEFDPIDPMTRYAKRVTTDGIEIRDTVLTLSEPRLIPHEVFRKWTYERGYWNEGYYDFLKTMRPVVVNIYIDEEGWPDEEE
jgi:hypothetical protein